MLQWIIRALFVVSGSISSWFVAKDALNFEIVQMVISVLLFTIAIAILAFWPTIKSWFKRKGKL